MSGNNPLSNFYRKAKLHTPLPSGTSYYTSDIVDFTTEDGQVEVFAMTAKDEVSIKNPDALLNGTAITQIIKSCVPCVKQPEKLLSNDIDALLIAIRYATYGESIDIKSNCPSCKKENTFGVNVSDSLHAMSKLEEEYLLETADQIKIYVQPFSYKETLLAMKGQFEQHKIAKSITIDQLDEDARLKMFSQSFAEVVDLNAKLIVNCVLKIIAPDGTEVTDKNHIKEFLDNSESHVFSEIDKLIRQINDVGVKKDFKATCQHCNHQWDSEINFNPVSFFTES